MKALVYWSLIALSVTLAGRREAQTLSADAIKSNLDLPFDAGLSKDDGDDESAPETIDFYSQQFEGDGIFYVIGIYGNMESSGELDFAKREVRRNIRGFGPHVQFGLIFFDSAIRRFPSDRRPAEATAATKAAALNWLDVIRGGGGKCCRQALLEALNYSSASSASRKVIVYVGDGGGSCNGSIEPAYLEKTLNVVRSRNFQRARINAVGVLEIGTIQGEFLRRLTSQSGGSYVKKTR